MTIIGLEKKGLCLLAFSFLVLFVLGLRLGRLMLHPPQPRMEISDAAPAAAPAARGSSSGEGDAAAFRLARDAELARQYEQLQGLAEGGRTETVRREAEEALWRLTRIEAAEHEAETALALQGWPGSTVSIVGNEATVIIRGRALSEAEAARVGRLVAAAAGLSESAVRIVEKP